MPATLLAVDDSQTMRKVLEMTFAGEDIRVVTAESFDTAIASMRSETPSLVISDITLPGKSGYDLCHAIKQMNPAVPVLLLSSKLHPYDPSRGQAARADGNLDKPFDTQQIIDRVKALLSADRKAAPEPPRPVQGPPKAAAPTPYRAPSPLSSTMVGTPPVHPAPVKPVAVPSTSHPAVAPSSLRSTIDFSSRQETPVRPQSSGRAPAPATAASPTRPSAPQPSPGAPAAAPAAAAVAAQMDGAMASKLTELGLSKDQIDAVLALSHDVVERVVWEVVPVLAETLIKEEIKRLMAE